MVDIYEANLLNGPCSIIRYTVLGPLGIYVCLVVKSESHINYSGDHMNIDIDIGNREDSATATATATATSRRRQQHQQRMTMTTRR